MAPATVELMTYTNVNSRDFGVPARLPETLKLQVVLIEATLAASALNINISIFLVFSSNKHTLFCKRTFLHCPDSD